MIGSTSAPDQRLAPRRAVLQTVAVVIAASALIAASGLIGYQQQMESNAAESSAVLSKRPKQDDGSLGFAGANSSVEPVRREDVLVDESRRRAPGSATNLVWPLWEFHLKQPIPPRSPPLTPVPWVTLGATQSSGEWSVVILRQGKSAPEFYKVGDTLPGGYRIAEITEENMTLSHAGQSLVLSYLGSR